MFSDLMNADPDPVRIHANKITKLISNHLLKIEKKKLFSNLYPNLTDYLLLYVQTRKIKICWLNPAFPFILYLWFGIKIHGPYESGSDRIRINIAVLKNCLVRCICQIATKYSLKKLRFIDHISFYRYLPIHYFICSFYLNFGLINTDSAPNSAKLRKPDL